MEKFITKLETAKYLIGSFDVYQDEAKNLMLNSSMFNSEEADKMLKSMPTTSRATILKKDGTYLGFIGLFDVDAKNKESSLIIQTNTKLNENDKEEILNEFKEYADKSLNINKIRKEVHVDSDYLEITDENIVPNSNIIIPSRLLEVGISNEDLEKFSSEYSVPKLQMPCTIKNSDKTIGIIGLSSLVWSNQRADLHMFFDKKLGDEITQELSGYVVDDYLNYVHSNNVHNVRLSVNGSKKRCIG